MIDSLLKQRELNPADMDEMILVQRMDFDEAWKRIAAMKDADEKCEFARTLLTYERNAEFRHIEGVIDWKIWTSGLDAYMHQIKTGMAHTWTRCFPTDVRIYASIDHKRQILRAESNALRTFALDYVERWHMYDELFRDR